MDKIPEEEQDPSQSPEDAPEPQPAPEAPAEAHEEAEQKRTSAEEALAELRGTLREEETHEKTGFRANLSRLWRRVFRRKEKLEEELVEAPSPLDELVFPEAPPASAMTTGEAGAAEALEVPSEPAPPPAPESKFGSMVRERLTGPLAEKAGVEPVAPEPEGPEHIIEEPEPEPLAPGHGILLSLRQEEEGGEEGLSELRQEALEDYVTAPAEEEEEVHTSLAGRLRRSWRYMRPMDRRLLIGAVVIVALAVLAGSGFLVVKSLPAPVPTATPTQATTPFPISISLPGGWIFPLRVGRVENGKWNPQEAEWLQGTEVCRWVSLPWTIQLEAVLRTLKENDEIKLSMSNYDTLVYKVESIDEVPASEVSKLAADTPCLLVILSKQGTETRWVVTAKP